MGGGGQNKSKAIQENISSPVSILASYFSENDIIASMTIEFVQTLQLIVQNDKEIFRIGR